MAACVYCVCFVAGVCYIKCCWMTYKTLMYTDTVYSNDLTVVSIVSIALYVRIHIRCVCVCMWGCPVQLLSDPSFLLFLNPSCMGQHMERASIWAPSPAYLLDTQVGTAHSSQLRPHRLTLLLCFPPCWLTWLCVFSVCDMGWLSSWDTSFSHVGVVHAILLCCTVPGPGPLSLCASYHTILYVVAA